MPALHGSREDHASQFARGNRWQRTIKENPNVAALPGTRTLQGSGHAQLLAGLKESLGVILPSLLVEVRREKPARFVGQEGIHANGFLAQEVVLDDGVAHREELPRLLIDLLSILRAALVDSLPVLYGRGRISGPAIGTLPSLCVDILSPAKQASKQRDSFSGALLLVHRAAPSRRFWLEADSLAQVAESECREPPAAAAGEHFPPGGECFPALEVQIRARRISTVLHRLPQRELDRVKTGRGGRH